MALTCPEELDVKRLRERVCAIYERVAEKPEGEFHFHRGRRYAVKQLNYSGDELLHIPPISSSRFTGVGNPHRAGPLLAGETVLDHACGAGMDLIIAAKRVGPQGRVIGVDATRGMLGCARRAVIAAGIEERASLFHGVYENLPVDDASIDVMISNGALNLAPDKRRVFAEILRVLKPGGRLHLADVVVQCELDDKARTNPELWAACVAGALRETELLQLAKESGLVGGRISERFDCFFGAAAEHAVPREARIGAVNFFARRPCVR